MAKSGGNKPGGPEPQSPDTAASEPAAAAPQANTLQVDDSEVVGCYTNFCRVTGTPEELIVDFGLNSQPMGVPTEPVQVTHRVIVNFYTAKRLWGALSMAIQRHEAAFGVLETDVQKRLRISPGTGA